METEIKIEGAAKQRGYSCGKVRTAVRLIYIENFMGSGYTRPSKAGNTGNNTCFVE